MISPRHLLQQRFPRVVLSTLQHSARNQRGRFISTQKASFFRTDNMSPYKVAFFNSKQYDINSFNKEASDLQSKGSDVKPPLEFTYHEPQLSEKTVSLAKGHDAACIFVNDVADKGVLEGLKEQGIKLLALRAAGTNNVDIKVAEELGITVVSVPAYSPQAVAEFAVGLILTIVRKYHKSYNRVREGNFALDGLVGFNLESRTIGVIGTGKIGLAAGKILSHGFGARVLGYDVFKDDEAAKEHGITYCDSLKDLLSQADIVTLHAPLTDQTKHIINEETISSMKDGAILVNTSRGGLVDTQALVSALKNQKLRAVGLDVYEKENEYFFQSHSSGLREDDLLARLTSFPEVIITGHQAFLTEEALSSIASTTINNILAVSRGEKCDNVVRSSQK